MVFQDRVTGILDAHLASVSNPAGAGLEAARRGRDAVRAADRADRALRHERAAAAPAGRGSGAVLVGRRRSWLAPRSAMFLWFRRSGLVVSAWAASASCPTTWPTRSPPARSSSGRPRSSRSWSRTPSTPRRRRIAVTVEYGGKRLIRVEDDGIGMDARRRAAVPRAARDQQDSPRPTTSAAIVTLGFRGEALPSIASVSRFTLRTRARGAVGGTEIRVNAGAGRVVARGRRARGHARRGRGPVLQPAGAAEVPEVRRRRDRAGLAGSSRSWRCAIRRSASR